MTNALTTAATYERVRSDPTTFILLPHHASADVESVIERGEGFLIARNFGRAAEIARANDPRVTASLPKAAVDPLTRRATALLTPGKPTPRPTPPQGVGTSGKAGGVSSDGPGSLSLGRLPRLLTGVTRLMCVGSYDACAPVRLARKLCSGADVGSEGCAVLLRVRRRILADARRRSRDGGGSR